jgi:hypothetical protein
MMDVGNVILGSIDIVDFFQRVLVPVLMISGIGLFILVIQTRYGRIVDRIRTLNMERRELIKQTLIKRISKFEKIWNDNRLQCLQEQMAILLRRGKLLKDSLRFMFIVIFSSIASSLILFIEQITKAPLSSIVLSLFVFGIIMLFIACINVIKEVSNSYNAVIYDIDTYTPQKYLVKNKLDLLSIVKEKDK